MSFPVHPTAPDDRDLVAQFFRHVQHMGGEENRAAGAVLFGVMTDLQYESKAPFPFFFLFLLLRKFLLRFHIGRDSGDDRSGDEDNEAHRFAHLLRKGLLVDQADHQVHKEQASRRDETVHDAGQERIAFDLFHVLVSPFCLSKECRSNPGRKIAA